MSKIEDAVSLFKQGFTRFQAVLCAFGQDSGMDEETTLKIASTFGGGMERMGEVCGCGGPRPYCIIYCIISPGEKSVYEIAD